MPLKSSLFFGFMFNSAYLLINELVNTSIIRVHLLDAVLKDTPSDIAHGGNPPLDSSFNGGNPRNGLSRKTADAKLIL